MKFIQLVTLTTLLAFAGSAVADASTVTVVATTPATSSAASTITVVATTPATSSATSATTVVAADPATTSSATSSTTVAAADPATTSSATPSTTVAAATPATTSSATPSTTFAAAPATTSEVICPSGAITTLASDIQALSTYLITKLGKDMKYRVGGYKAHQFGESQTARVTLKIPGANAFTKTDTNAWQIGITVGLIFAKCCHPGQENCCGYVDDPIIGNNHKVTVSIPCS